MRHRQLKSLQEVRNLRMDATRGLFSANHDEIYSGATTDIYFIRTKEILYQMGLDNTEVIAEIFPRKSGIMAGVDEAVSLLRNLDIDAWAVPDGSEFKAKDVVMRIRGRYYDFGIYETALLGIMANSSGWATSAKKAKDAAGDKPVFCFGARHVHPAVAPAMERCAIAAGFDGASCVLGAKLAGMEPVGTVPHAFFLIVGDTVRAAKAYNEIMPSGAPRLILVDTFKDEAEETLRVAEALGTDLYGVRLDTPGERGGVTPELVREIRFRLNKGGYDYVKIFVSGGLYPEKMAELKEAGADAFGVGTYISSAPPIDMTLDLKQVNGVPIAKRGRLPGIVENPKLEKIL